MAQEVKNPLAVQEIQEIQFLGQEDPLEKEMATYSSILAWEIPWTEEPGRLQFMGSQESDRTEHAHAMKKKKVSKEKKSKKNFPVSSRKQFMRAFWLSKLKVSFYHFY